MCSYAVAGSNIFGQWFSDEFVIEGFKRMSKKCSDPNFDLDKARLVQANWSYNIFELNGVYYVSGSWMKKEKQLAVLPLPAELATTDRANMLVSGNDNYLVLADTVEQLVYVIDLKFKTSVKRLNLVSYIEDEPEPLTKKKKKNNQLVKLLLTNNACIYMRFVNREMKVYNGLIPKELPTENVMGRIIDVQCGYEHYILLTDTGKVYTWGNGRRLQLGHGGIENVEKPREVRSLAGFNIKKIRAGGWHSAVVSEFGNLYMWGWNDVGQVGIKTRTQRRKELTEAPTVSNEKSFQISSVVYIYDEELKTVRQDVIDVYCGTKHTVILLADYSVWASGSNEYGQLGLPIKDCTHIDYYVKVFQGTSNSTLRCGPWTTVIEN